MPVAKAPNAPEVQVWESAPTKISVGFTNVSTNLWWQTPEPTSDKSTYICCQESALLAIV